MNIVNASEPLPIPLPLPISGSLSSPSSGSSCISTSASSFPSPAFQSTAAPGASTGSREGTRPFQLGERRALPDSYSEFQTHPNSHSYSSGGRSARESHEGENGCACEPGECRYLFVGRPGTRVRLTFTELDLFDGPPAGMSIVASIPSVVHYN